MLASTPRPGESSGQKEHLSEATPVTPTAEAASVRPAYKHIYTVDDLTELHGLSRRTVIRLYEREEGVQALFSPKEGVRRYRTLRVPHYVYERVRGRLERGITSNPIQRLIDERETRDREKLEAFHRGRIERKRATRRFVS